MSNKDDSQPFRLDDNIISVVEKFKNFRREFDVREKKLKEYKTFIEQLTDETKISREVEKHLREQVNSSQNRSTQLQITLKKFTAISERQKRNEIISENIEKNIEELDMMVKKAQENINNLKTRALAEMDLQKQNDELKSALKAKESELNLLKIDLQSLLKEKSDCMLKSETKLKELEEELKKSRRECEEIKNQCDEITSMYKKEIEEREEIIKEYEIERKGLLEDFDTTKIPSTVFTNADSTVSLNMEERKSLEQSNPILEVESQYEAQSGLFYCTPVQSTKSGGKKNENSKKLSKNRVRPKLQIFTQEPSDSPQPPKKRRLFSTNCNHYLFQFQ